MLISLVSPITYDTNESLHFCLTGDVGGYMGLLLGGSVITVFEFFDFIISYFLMTCATPRSKRRGVDATNDIENQRNFNSQSEAGRKVMNDVIENTRI